MKWNLVTASAIELNVERELYDESVIYKCLYWYGGEYVVDVSIIDQFFVITLKARTGMVDQKQAEIIVDKLKTDLIDFKTRQLIRNETDDIAKVLIAKAFTRSEDLDFKPPGSLSEFQNNR